MVRRNLDNFDLEEEKDHSELPCMFTSLIIYADGLFSGWGYFFPLHGF